MIEGRIEVDQHSLNNPCFPSALLPTLTNLAQAIVATFGDGSEVVIHDLSDRSSLDHTIVAVAGNVTGRPIGGPPTDVLLRKLRSKEELGDFLVYESTTRDGRLLKSSTTFIRDQSGQIVGSFCVNFDITQLVAAAKTLSILCTVGDKAARLDGSEVFATAVTETLDTMIDDAMGRQGKPVAHMGKSDKMKVVSYLDSRGAFLIRGAVGQVARRLAVSRYSIYNYMNEIRTSQT